MRRLIAAINAVRTKRQWAATFLIAVVMTAFGFAALLPTTNGAHAQAVPDGINNSTLVLTADGSIIPDVDAAHKNARFAKGACPESEKPLKPVDPPLPRPAGAMRQVPFGSDDLGQMILDFRRDNNITGARNVAIFEYYDLTGKLMTCMIPSKFRWDHAERRIARELKRRGIPNENVRRIRSELEPCTLPGRNCKKMITEGINKGRPDDDDDGGGGGGIDDPLKPVPPLGPYLNADVTFYYEYGDTRESRQRAVDQLEKDVLRYLGEQREKAGRAFQAPGKTGVARSALVDTLSQRSASSLGGIDFSSLELRYLSDRRSGDGANVQYAFTALPAASDQPTNVALHAVNQASDSFFVWLALPTSKFTVNLNPDEPNRIIDADFGRTDAGRVLLEADLHLKKTVAQLIHPDTPLGVQFWEALKGEGSKSCLSFRQWIVPAPADIYENSDELYILNAPLSVKMETEYFQARGLDNSGTTCDKQEKSIEEHNEAVFRTMILPHLEQAVNEAPEYAELRRVYLSRVAAEWYRNRNAHNATQFTGLINSGDITPWTPAQPWSPQDVFNRYVESFTKGEFNVTRHTQDGNVMWTKTYVFGGVDFTNIQFHNMSAGDFQRERPELLKTVEQAFDHPTSDRKGKIWLGFTDVPPSSGQRSGGHLPIYLVLATIGAAACAAIWARSWWRLRRKLPTL